MASPSLLGFRSQTDEVASTVLPVTGRLPPWLAGTLLRNGPALFEVGRRRVAHWFDGLSMLHRFTIGAGQVTYRNRLLQSRELTGAVSRGELSCSLFATDPCRSLFGRLRQAFRPCYTDNASVSIDRWGDRFVALTESPLAVEFDPETLEAVGVVDPGALRRQVVSAHPHLDPRTGERFTHATRYSLRSRYAIHVLGKGAGEWRTLGTVPVSRPAYLHSFALTANYVVLAEFPLAVSPLASLLRGRPFIENFQWHPERGTRIILVSRKDGVAQVVGEAEAFFAFHHINAFERDGWLVLDVAAYEDPSIIELLRLDRLADCRSRIPAALPKRLALRVDGTDMTTEVLCDTSIELPTTDYNRRNAAPYSIAYGVGVARDGAQSFLDELVKLDVARRNAVHWREEGCYPGEPVFVPRPRGAAEDDGVVLSVVLDTRGERSFLLVLDAGTLTEVARAFLPHHVPFGFHGRFFAAGEGSDRTAGDRGSRTKTTRT